MKKHRYRKGLKARGAEQVAGFVITSLALMAGGHSSIVSAEDAATNSSASEQLESILGDSSQPAAPETSAPSQPEPAPAKPAQAAGSEAVIPSSDSAQRETIHVDAAGPSQSNADQPAPYSNPRQLEEIVVTATKRDESVRQIPTTINVMSGAQLESQGARQLSDFIDQVPGIKMQDQSGVTPRKIAVRGVGPDDTTNQTVGTVLGDIPLGDPYGSYTVVDPDPFDLQTVEVLKGPQGSLFGASSLSGLIRYVPNAPILEQWQGKGFAQWTSIKDGGADPTYGAMINVPVGSTIAFRGSGVLDHAPGYINFDTPGYMVRNGDDSHKWSGRAMALWQPTEKLSLNLLAMGQQAHGDQFPFTTNGNYQLERNDEPSASPFRRGFKMAAVDARYSFDWATLVSLSGYQNKINKFNQDVTYNFEGEPLAQQGITLARALRDVKAHGFVQEVRLVSPDSDTWTWLAGTVYSSYVANINSDIYIPAAALATQAVTDLLTPLGLGNLAQGVGDENGLTVGKQVLSPVWAKERALFGELSRQLGPVKLTAGGRLYKTSIDGTSESSGVAATVANQMPVTTAKQSVDGGGFSPKAAITWQATDDILLYASAARGYQFGGINVVPIPIDPHPATYKSSTLWSYETGIRTDWFDNTLRADLSIYDLDWKNAQVSQVGVSGVDEWVDNVGVVDSRGLESTLQYLFPIDGLSIDVSGAYTKATTSVPFVNSQGNTVVPGTMMPNSPTLQASSTLAYSRLFFDAWKLSSAVAYTYSSSSWNDINHDNKLDAKSIVNLNLSVARVEGSYHPTFGLVVSNLTNQIKIASVGAGPANTALAVNPVLYTRPRTIEMKFAVDF